MRRCGVHLFIRSKYNPEEIKKKMADIFCISDSLKIRKFLFVVVIGKFVYLAMSIRESLSVFSL